MAHVYMTLGASEELKDKAVEEFLAFGAVRGMPSTGLEHLESEVKSIADKSGNDAEEYLGPQQIDRDALKRLKGILLDGTYSKRERLAVQ